MRKIMICSLIAILFLLPVGCLEEQAEDLLPLPEADPAEEEQPSSVSDEEAEDPVQDLLLLVYSQQDMLLSSVGYNPPCILTSGYGDYDPLISPDGNKVIFKRPAGGGETDLELFDLWVLELDNSEAYPLVTTADLPGAPDQWANNSNSELLQRLPLQIDWLPDSSAVLFNTELKVGYGVHPFNDLWIAPLEEGPVTRVLSDSTGGNFSISPDGEVLLIADFDSVMLVELESLVRREVFSFLPVNTASEFPFIPMAVWAPDSQYALVAIPDPEPYSFEPEPSPLEIWRLPRNGEAELCSSSSSFNFWDAMSGDLISPDGQHFAYSTGPFLKGNTHIATLDGEIVNSFGFAYDFMGWSTDGNYIILYADSPFLGGLTVEGRELDMHEETDAWSAAYKWVGPSTYVGLDFSYFHDQSIAWVTEIGGESRVIDYDVTTFDAMMIP